MTVSNHFLFRDVALRQKKNMVQWAPQMKNLSLIIVLDTIRRKAESIMKGKDSKLRMDQLIVVTNRMPGWVSAFVLWDIYLRYQCECS